MRVTKLTLLALLCAALVAGAGCGGGEGAEPTPTPSPIPSGIFEIYLVNTSNMSQVNFSDLDSIPLQDEPILSATDIIAYYWDDRQSGRHDIELTDEGCRYFWGEVAKTDTVYCSFIVIVNGERIYRGAFWPMYSSLYPVNPSIWYLPPGGCNYSSGITIYGGTSDRTDLLYDSRIYSALKQAGILIE